MIPLIIGAVMLLSSSSGDKQIEVSAIAETASVEQYVRTYFADTPILAEIARCESRFRQFDASGHLLRGEMVSQDVGLMQINEYYHLQVSKDLGYDIKTIDGNLAYGKYLYEKEGVAPWRASQKCWGAAAKQVAKK
jgi:hypothetical protein